MARAARWAATLRKALARCLCFLLGHRPIVCEAELRELYRDPSWRFRCGDCGRRYWWP